jgi:hypothetical protein
MDSVKFTGFSRRQMDQFHGYNAKASLNDVIKDRSNMAIFNGIGLDHGKSPVTHKIVFFAPAKKRHYKQMGKTNMLQLE